MMLVAYIFARRYNFPVEEPFNLARLKRTFIHALPTFSLPVIILGGIFGGFVTATEAARLAVIAALLVGAYYRAFDPRILKTAMLHGVMQTAVGMLPVAAPLLAGGFIARAPITPNLP